MKKFKTSKASIYQRKSIIYFVQRYNFVLFIIVLACGLALCILILSGILSIIYTDNTTSTTNQATTMFSQTTIDELSNLNASANNTSYQDISSGSRVSPFTE